MVKERVVNPVIHKVALFPAMPRLCCTVLIGCEVESTADDIRLATEQLSTRAQRTLPAVPTAIRQPGVTLM